MCMFRVMGLNVECGEILFKSLKLPGIYKITLENDEGSKGLDYRNFVFTRLIITCDLNLCILDG